MKQSQEHSKGDRSKGHQGHSASSHKGKEQHNPKGNAQEKESDDMERGKK